MKSIGHIYIIENDINNMVYIGQTIQNLNIRLAQHIYDAENYRRDSKFCKAIRELGAEHFRIKELVSCEVDSLNKLEVYYIKQYNSVDCGYNTTYGGDGIRPYMSDKDVVEFIADFKNPELTKLEIATKYGCTVKTVNTLARVLLLKNIKKTNDIDTDTPIFMYDYDFEPMKYFSSIYEARQWIRENTKYYNAAINDIKYATKSNGLAYGYRWQLRNDLIDKEGRIFCTSIDKELVNKYNKEAELYKGGLRVKNIVYADYVGESARENCSICGTKLNKNNQCDACRIRDNEEEKAIKEQVRLSRIIELAGQGMNLTQIGNEIGMSANGVKKLLARNNMAYNTNENNKHNIEVVDICGYIHVVDKENLYKFLVDKGICKMKSKHNFYAKVKENAENEKTTYGLKMRMVEDKINSIVENINI